MNTLESFMRWAGIIGMFLGTIILYSPIIYGPENLSFFNSGILLINTGGFLMMYAVLSKRVYELENQDGGD